MASITLKRPVSPGKAPDAPKKPTAKPMTEKRKELVTKRVVSIDKTTNQLKLLEVLKGVPDNVELDDVYIEIGAKCLAFPSDHAEGIVSIITIETKKNPKYKRTMERYAAELKAYEEAKKTWEVKTNKYKKDMKEYDEHKRQKRLKQERDSLLKRMEFLDQELEPLAKKKKGKKS